MEDIILNFKNNTLDPVNFQIEDVASDNACLYRSIANQLLYRNKSNNIENLNMLISNKNKTFDNNYLDIFEKDGWGYDGEKQEKLARILQEEMVCWLLANQDEIYDNDLNISYKELIENTHLMTLEEYQLLYSYFAGDDIKVEIETKRKDKIGNTIMKKVSLDNRWGGLPEIVAISNITNLPIIVYSSQKYDIRRNKIITGKILREKAIKGVRFKPYIIINSKLLENRPPILLLWKKEKHGAHYMSLYQIDKNIRFNQNGFVIS